MEATARDEEFGMTPLPGPGTHANLPDPHGRRARHVDHRHAARDLKSIRTIVQKDDPAVIAEAIRRELAPGGRKRC
jgi:hypothetical protein